MKKLCLFFALLISLTENVQSQNSLELHDTAKAYMRQGDYNNAVIFLKKALEISPSNPGIIKDLALNYYFQKENTKALDIIKPLLEGPEADAQSFQIAGNIYKALDQPKEAEAMYKKALKRFSDSGV